MKQDKLTEKQKIIIEQMKKNPRITQWELSIILDVNTRTIERNVKILKDKGMIKRLGPRYKSIDRRWEVLRTPDS